MPRSESLASVRGDDRVLLFDALRVVAIGMVLLSHVLITIGPPWSEVGQPYLGVEGFYRATWGQLGVTIFLVVSGLCLEFASRGRQIRPVRFFLGRVVRIYPVYYMSLL
ncbi:MAG: acyltransferase family protein, partial [Nitrospiria bacterium]